MNGCNAIGKNKLANFYKDGGLRSFTRLVGDWGVCTLRALDTFGYEILGRAIVESSTSFILGLMM